MNTFDVVRDVVYDENPWIILREEDLAKLADAGKADAAAKSQAAQLAELRKEHADKIHTVKVTVKKPTVSDRVEILSACRRAGELREEYMPVEACVRLIQDWDLPDPEKPDKNLPLTRSSIEQSMPLAVLDALWGEIYPYLYPSTARLAFFQPWRA